MKLRVGYELRYAFPQPTPVILMLNIHFTRVSDLAMPDHIIISPSVPISGYRDGFGNWCTRIVAPAGKLCISTDAVVSDSGLPDPVVPSANQVPVEELPEETLVFLLGSRFCDSDRLLDLAWTLFGHATPGWGRVQAICDFVHQRITFGYEHARVTRTASEAYQEGRGVCRDYTHLAVAFCRALNIPARYCTGYLGDVGTPPPYPPGDFAALARILDEVESAPERYTRYGDNARMAYKTRFDPDANISQLVSIYQFAVEHPAWVSGLDSASTQDATPAFR